MLRLLNISCQLRLTNKLPDLLVNILPSMWLLISHSFCETLVTDKQAEINRERFHQLPNITVSVLCACMVIQTMIFEDL